jgi:hypothetical protein
MMEQGLMEGERPFSESGIRPGDDISGRVIEGYVIRSGDLEGVRGADVTFRDDVFLDVWPSGMAGLIVNCVGFWSGPFIPIADGLSMDVGAIEVVS